jgi:uncharacterized integral membrane protein
MSALLWLLRGFLFILLLGLAIKNSSDVELRFFFDAAWQAPLSVVILVAMVVGVVFGLLALLPALIRQRREIGRLRRQAARNAEVLLAEPIAPKDA